VSYDEYPEIEEQFPGRSLEPRGPDAARLLRDPQCYVDAFGAAAYRVTLGDCLWHVYG
jgi:hypothetical protein